MIVLILRLLHIGAGVFWVGSILFLARFLMPSVMALGPAAGPVMDQLNRVRRLPQALLGAGFVTVLSGFGLYWIDSLGFRGPWMESPTGRVFGAGAGFALIGLIIGFAVNRPAAQRLGALAAAIQAGDGPPTAEQMATMRALQARLANATRLLAVLLALATAAMALARYVT
jgi:uncharacterized membrane protein